MESWWHNNSLPVSLEWHRWRISIGRRCTDFISFKSIYISIQPPWLSMAFTYTLTKRFPSSIPTVTFQFVSITYECLHICHTTVISMKYIWKILQILDMYLTYFYWGHIMDDNEMTLFLMITYNRQHRNHFSRIQRFIRNYGDILCVTIMYWEELLWVIIMILIQWLNR